MNEKLQKRDETEIQVTEELKKLLVEEKEKNNEKATRLIRRYGRFRFNLIIYSVFYLLIAPYMMFFSSFTSGQRFLGSSYFLLFLLLVVYVVTLYVLLVLIVRGELRRSAKLICFYSSVSAAQSLEKGNLVEGSHLVTRLFDLIVPFSEVEKVNIGYFKSSLKQLFLGDIEQLHQQRVAVGRAILENGKMSKQFSNHLYILANSLFSMERLSNFDEGIASLRFFIQNSKSYFQPATYLQKHKKVGIVTRVLSEIGKNTLIPVLLFVLWLIFGYR